MKPHKPIRYKINFETEDLKDYYIRQWVWKWVEQFHPEAFQKAEEYVNKRWEQISVENTPEETI